MALDITKSYIKNVDDSILIYDTAWVSHVSPVHAYVPPCLSPYQSVWRFFLAQPGQF